MEKLFSLAVLRSYAGSGSSCNYDWLLEEVCSGSADVGSCNYYLSCLELHLSGGVADLGNLAYSLDVVSCVGRSEELYVVVCAEETFVSVKLDDVRIALASAILKFSFFDRSKSGDILISYVKNNCKRRANGLSLKLR